MLLQSLSSHFVVLGGKKKKKTIPKSHIKSQWSVEEQEGKIQAKFMWLVPHVALVD